MAFRRRDVTYRPRCVRDGEISRARARATLTDDATKIASPVVAANLSLGFCGSGGITQ